MNRTIILGAGAIGSVLASELIAAGQDVTIVARGRRAMQLRSDGLQIVGPRSSASFVEVIEPGCPLPEATRIIVAVKQPQFFQAICDLSGSTSATTPVAVAMNGLPWWLGRGTGADAALRALLDRSGTLESVLEHRPLQALVLYFGATLLPDGTSDWPGRGRVVSGDVCGSAIPLPRLPNLAVDHVSDIRVAIFEKLMGNLSYGPIAMLTGMTNAAIAGDRGLVERQLAIAEDLVRLAQAFNLAVPMNPAAVLADGASFGNAFKASMLVDYERGSQPEIEALLAAPCLAARALGLPVPALEALWDACLARLEARSKAVGRVGELGSVRGP